MRCIFCRHDKLQTYYYALAVTRKLILVLIILNIGGISVTLTFTLALAAFL